MMNWEMHLLVNLSRFLNVQPELALNGTIGKFIKRFEYINKAKAGRKLEDMSLSEMDELWNEAKVQLGRAMIKFGGKLMNKAELVGRMAEKGSITKADAEKALNVHGKHRRGPGEWRQGAARWLRNLWGKGEARRKGRNPQTNEEIATRHPGRLYSRLANAKRYGKRMISIWGMCFMRSINISRFRGSSKAHARQ